MRNSNFFSLENNSFLGLMSIKDAESRYIFMTNQTAKLVGWKSADDCVGKMDHDLPNELSQSAPNFIELDKKVLATEQKMLTIDIQQYNKINKIILVERAKIIDQYNNVGISCQGIDVSDSILFRSYLMLHQADSARCERLKGTYVLTSSYFPFKLTERQEICLFLIIRGKSVKEIASYLKISTKTVDCHLDAIKAKLNCYSKSALIEKAIEYGCLRYVPKSCHAFVS